MRGLGVALALAAACGARHGKSRDGAVDANGDSPTDAALPFSLELMAGDIGGPGNADGTGTNARFFYPASVAVDGAGNIYVADAINSTIRKIASGAAVTTLAGMPGMTGGADGTGAAARFSLPSGVAVDGSGNVYVADALNDTIRKIAPGGAVTTLAGTNKVPGSTDATGSAARFNNPSGVAVDASGTVYLADAGNNTIRKITVGGVVTTLAGTAGMSGSVDGTGAAARFNGPVGVAVDSSGNVYVADQNNDTIRKVAPGGVVTTLAGTAGMTGGADGTGAAARFDSPAGIAVDGAGNLYIGDLNNDTIRKITAGGVVSTLAGAIGIIGSTDGTGPSAHFFWPAGVAVDGSGALYIADTHNDTIRKLAGGVVATLAGTAALSGSTDGTGASARFDSPRGVAVDSAGTIYVADRNNDTIRKIVSGGVVTTYAGTPGAVGSADGTGANARFYVPEGVAEASGTVYVADTVNSTIRVIVPGGGVTTIAGTPGTIGSADGTGAGASFWYPKGVAADTAGNIYVADTNNGEVRKVTPPDAVTTLSTGFDPSGVAVDGSGNVYVAADDTVRKVTPTGAVTTLAGTFGIGGSADGTGAAARFSGAWSVALDAAGNAYITDFNNSTIRKVTPAGVVTTIAGTPGLAKIVLGTNPGFAYPIGIAVVGDSLVITDSDAVLLLRHGAQ